MQIEDGGFICDTNGRSKSERVAAFVGLCATSSGAILCAFQIGSAKNAADSKLLLFRSRDEGQTWHEIEFRFESKIDHVPGSFSSGEIVEVESNRLLLIATWYDRSDPNRPLFDPVTEGILHSKQLTAFSDDDGDTWSSWRELPIHGLKGCTSTGPILKWPDGLIAYPFENLKEFDDPAPAVPGAWCILSWDRGKTFSPPVLVARHPQNKVYYWDQRLCAGKRSGEFIGFFWSHDRENKRDLAVHFRKASLLHDTLQTAPLVPTCLAGQIAAPLLLADGRLLAFVVSRTQPGKLTLSTSCDGGLNWPESLVIHVQDEQQRTLAQTSENIDYAQYWEEMGKWCFGHPAILSLGTGKVLLAYYAGGPTGTSTRWARVSIDT